MANFVAKFTEQFARKEKSVGISIFFIGIKELIVCEQDKGIFYRRSYDNGSTVKKMPVGLLAQKKSAKPLFQAENSSFN
jgi:hypothetical protein